MNLALQPAPAAATQFGTWMSYGGTAKLVLAGGLLAVAAGVAYTGTRLSRPVGLRRPGQTTAIVIVAGLLLAIVAFLVCLSVYVQQLRRDHLLHVGPANPITPVTLICDGAVFFVVVLSSSRANGVTWSSALIAALAAPMIFELPFDLIVMARTYPPVPPDPALYRALFFAPLFLIEILALSLLTLSPMVKVSRMALYSFASMLAVFAVWALSGFAYPSTPLPLTLNVVSKILAFVTTLCLFLPQRSGASAPAGPASPSLRSARHEVVGAGTEPRLG
jgi:hypothetical protein